MIGKPDSGKPTVRFDEGELEIEPFWLLHQFSTLLDCATRQDNEARDFNEETLRIISIYKSTLLL
jgi:hypothetical protein